MVTVRNVKTAINEMVGDMSVDIATAIQRAQEVAEYASNLVDVLSAGESDEANLT